MIPFILQIVVHHTSVSQLEKSGADSTKFASAGLLAFGVKTGVEMELEGEANDMVSKPSFSFSSMFSMLVLEDALDFDERVENARFTRFLAPLMARRKEYVALVSDLGCR